VLVSFFVASVYISCQKNEIKTKCKTCSKIQSNKTCVIELTLQCVGVVVVRMLREELQLLQEQGSYVGEVVKPMDKKKVLVKVISRVKITQSADVFVSNVDQ